MLSIRPSLSRFQVVGRNSGKITLKFGQGFSQLVHEYFQSLTEDLKSKKQQPSGALPILSAQVAKEICQKANINFTPAKTSTVNAIAKRLGFKTRGNETDFSNHAKAYVDQLILEHQTAGKDVNEIPAIRARKTAKKIAEKASIPFKIGYAYTLMYILERKGLQYQKRLEAHSTAFTRRLYAYFNEQEKLLAEQHKRPQDLPPLCAREIANKIAKEVGLDSGAQLHPSVVKIGRVRGFKFQTRQQSKTTEFSKNAYSYFNQLEQEAKRENKPLKELAPQSATELAKLIARRAGIPFKRGYAVVITYIAKVRGFPLMTTESPFSKQAHLFFQDLKEKFSQENLLPEELKPESASKIAKIIAEKAGISFKYGYSYVANYIGRSYGFQFSTKQYRDRVLLEEIFGKPSKYGFYGKNGFIPRPDPKAKTPEQLLVEKEEASINCQLQSHMKEAMETFSSINPIAFQLLCLTTGYALTGKQDATETEGLALSLEEAAKQLGLKLDQAQIHLQGGLDFLRQYLLDKAESD